MYIYIYTHVICASFSATNCVVDVLSGRLFPCCCLWSPDFAFVYLKSDSTTKNPPPRHLLMSPTGNIDKKLVKKRFVGGKKKTKLIGKL